MTIPLIGQPNPAQVALAIDVAKRIYSQRMVNPDADMEKELAYAKSAALYFVNKLFDEPNQDSNGKS